MCRIESDSLLKSSKEACQEYQFIKVRLRYLNVPWTAMELAKIRKFQLPVAS